MTLKMILLFLLFFTNGTVSIIHKFSLPVLDWVVNDPEWWGKQRRPSDIVLEEPIDKKWHSLRTHSLHVLPNYAECIQDLIRGEPGCCGDTASDNLMWYGKIYHGTIRAKKSLKYHDYKFTYSELGVFLITALIAFLHPPIVRLIEMKLTPFMGDLMEGKYLLNRL